MVKKYGVKLFGTVVAFFILSSCSYAASSREIIEAQRRDNAAQIKKAEEMAKAHQKEMAERAATAQKYINKMKGDRDRAQDRIDEYRRQNPNSTPQDFVRDSIAAGPSYGTHKLPPDVKLKPLGGFTIATLFLEHPQMPKNPRLLQALRGHNRASAQLISVNPNYYDLDRVYYIDFPEEQSRFSGFYVSGLSHDRGVNHIQVFIGSMKERDEFDNLGGMADVYLVEE